MMKNSCRLLLILSDYGWLMSPSHKDIQEPHYHRNESRPEHLQVGDDFYLVTSTFEYFPGLPVIIVKTLFIGN